MRDISRRHWLKATGTSIGLAALAGCSGDGEGQDSTENQQEDTNQPTDETGSQEGTTIVPRSAGGSFGDLLTRVYYEPYEEESNNTIESSHGDQGAAEAEIRANPDDPPYSLYYATNTTFYSLAEAGYIRDDVPDLFSDSTLDKVIDAAIFDETVGDLVAPLGIIVNRDQVDIEINSWTDLHNSELEGRVAYPSWGFHGRDLFYFINSIEGGSIENIDPGLEYIRGLVENDLQIYDNSDHGLRLVTEEEVWVAPFYNARAHQANQDTDIDFEFVYPEGGSFLQVYGYSIPTGVEGEELDAAIDFYESIFTPEKAGKMAEAFSYHMSTIGWEEHVSDEVLNENPFIPIPDEDLEAMGEANSAVDWQGAVQYHDEHANRFRRIITGG